MLGNGFDYWLGGSSCDTNFIFKLGNDGSLIGSGNRACGVRPVVYLQSGVKIDSSNPGTGADSDNAYQIVI